MAQSLKFVVLGTTTPELKEYLEATTQFMKGTEVTYGDVAGSRVYRFSGRKEMEDGTRREISVFGSIVEPDFRGMLTLLVKNADGVIGLVPASLERVTESRKVLGAVHRAIQFHRLEERNLPFVVQYHWSSQEKGPSPEELDRELGLNPQVVERVFSQAGGEGAQKGVLTLLESLQRLNSSPK